MQNVFDFQSKSVRLVGLGLAAATLIAAAGTSIATFQATSPGRDLSPVSGAEAVIDLIQGHQSVLWTSITGSVTNVRTVGWPTSDGIHDLGGALTIERPADQMVGIVDFGEKPMSMTFDVNG